MANGIRRRKYFPMGNLVFSVNNSELVNTAGNFPKNPVGAVKNLISSAFANGNNHLKLFDFVFEKFDKDSQILQKDVSEFFRGPQGVYETQFLAQISVKDTIDVGDFTLLFFRAKDSHPELHQLLVRESHADPQIEIELEALIFFIALALSSEAINMGLAEVIKVSPNWLFSGTPHGTVSGGPGGLPVPSPIEEPDYEFTPITYPGSGVSGGQEALKAAEGEGGPIHIYVLDTIPNPGDLEDLVNNKLYPNNHLLHELVSVWSQIGPLIETSQYLDLAYYEFYQNYAEDIEFRRENVMECMPPHDFSDHGLFIAGIIHSILKSAGEVCRVKIHLIQALNNFCLGTTDSLAWAISQVPQNLSNVFVNSSFRLAFHPSICSDPNVRRCADQIDLEDWFLETWICLSIQIFNNFHNISSPSSFHTSTGPIRDLFTQLTIRNMVVSAAAGNDSILNDSLNDQVKTPYPAAYAGVRGIGALKKDMTPARYSNTPDHLQINEGYWAFGGEVKENGSFSRAKVPQGILGLYIGSFPSNNQVNNNGWAFWAGSSFATAVATGYFAAKQCLIASGLGSSISPDRTLAQTHPNRQDLAQLPAPIRDGIVIPLEQKLSFWNRFRLGLSNLSINISNKSSIWNQFLRRF